MSTQIAYNVPGWRRFCGCDKGIAKQFQQPQKCGGANPCRGRKPEHGFAEPEPPKGGEALTVC